MLFHFFSYNKFSIFFFQGPEITIDNADVNFDLVSLGETRVEHIFIRNNCQIPAKWSIAECQEFSANVEEMVIFQDDFSSSMKVIVDCAKSAHYFSYH